MSQEETKVISDSPQQTTEAKEEPSKGQSKSQPPEKEEPK